MRLRLTRPSTLTEFTLSSPSRTAALMVKGVYQKGAATFRVVVPSMEQRANWVMSPPRHFYAGLLACSRAMSLIFPEVPIIHPPTVSTMSEGAPAEPPTKQMAEVRLDADGKPLSKNALKKLLKAEKAAKAKAEKEAKRVRPARRAALSTACVDWVDCDKGPILSMRIWICRLNEVLIYFLLTSLVSLSTRISCAD